MTTLDIGCGSMNSHTARGDINLDLNPNPVNRPENFVPGDAHHLPFKDCQFESVSFLEVIEHAENPSQCLREIWRVLKPNGVVKISTPNPTQWRTLLRHLLHIRVTVWHDHIACWGFAELENLLRINKFEIVEQDYVLVPKREQFEKWTHRIPDRIMHKFSLCHALTGRSIQVTARKLP